MTIASASAAVLAASSPLTASPAPAAILAAALHLFPHLERGQPVDAATLRGAMEAAFGASDASGAWDWKTAYEACEAATVLFLRKYGKAVFRKSGSPAASLPRLAKIASLMPTHTRRSEETQAFQQFSTPVPLGVAALAAAAITPLDRVLEPSAGTGLLAILAETAGATLMLNELAETRAALLSSLFPAIPVTLIDADPQGSALDWSQQRSREGLERLFGVVGLARDTLHREAPELARDADHVVIDGPPRVAGLMRSALLAADLVLIPVQPSPLDGWASAEMLALLGEARIYRPQLAARFVLNRCAARTILARETAETLADHDPPLLSTTIGQRIVFADVVQTGRLAAEQDEDCPGAREIAALAAEVARIGA